MNGPANKARHAAMTISRQGLRGEERRYLQVKKRCGKKQRLVRMVVPTPSKRTRLFISPSVSVSDYVLSIVASLVSKTSLGFFFFKEEKENYKRVVVDINCIYDSVLRVIDDTPTLIF